ncbi:DUF58 domain-containing protein [Bifidobacterium sp. SMB2]|uniref:DUF58 domain-containing protein n=1 Tax=Bifidobacterium saimiriisciurei TaxID=2661627 RepID=A0ABX0CHK5_9BIFI|nr:MULTISPECIES: DUF58 domain-containing protein [Bifidobacterium]NEG96758.1 DUF58 domain-containing protein [Bifidobacterium sp. SMB2]NEH12324.1 DUF58 domain-containing protein [Bifidobacterium saimiriisciurei]
MAHPALHQHVRRRGRSAPPRRGRRSDWRNKGKRPLRFLKSYVSPLGWTVLGFAVVCGVAFSFVRWHELLAMCVVASVMMVIAIGLSLGNTGFSAALSVPSRHLTVGDVVPVDVSIKNPGKTPTTHARGDLSLGTMHESFSIPALAPKQEKHTSVEFTTISRAVLPVGPLRIRKGDPFGLIRHEKTLASRINVFIHPKIARLQSLNAGIQRDLEGQPSGDIVDDDLDFYGLREYQPGDDMRNVHWLSTAKSGKLMIRQYEATRKTTTALGIGVSPHDYVDAAEFELAVSVYASIGVQCVLQERQLHVLVDDEHDTPKNAMGFLDSCSAILPDAEENPNLSVAALRHCPDASLYCFVVGSMKNVEVIKRMVMPLPKSATCLVLCADMGAQRSIRRFDDFVLATIGELDDLPMVMGVLA